MFHQRTREIPHTAYKPIKTYYHLYKPIDVQGDPHTELAKVVSGEIRLLRLLPLVRHRISAAAVDGLPPTARRRPPCPLLHPFHRLHLSERVAHERAARHAAVAACGGGEDTELL